MQNIGVCIFQTFRRIAYTHKFSTKYIFFCCLLILFRLNLWPCELKTILVCRNNTCCECNFNVYEHGPSFTQFNDKQPKLMNKMEIGRKLKHTFLKLWNSLSLCVSSCLLCMFCLSFAGVKSTLDSIAETLWKLQWETFFAPTSTFLSRNIVWFVEIEIQWFIHCVFVYASHFECQSVLSSFYWNLQCENSFSPLYFRLESMFTYIGAPPLSSSAFMSHLLAKLLRFPFRIAVFAFGYTARMEGANNASIKIDINRIY